MFKTINIKKVALFYFVTIIIYGLLMLLFSSPVHVGSDEQLYIALARSFHYDHNFVVGGVAKNYGSVLYSLIISVAYYFYNPQYIILIMRLINVLIGVSVIFPTYLLVDRAGLTHRQSWYIVIMSVLIPESLNVAFVTQEVILYPLFIWSVYFIYKDIEVDTSAWNTVITGALLVLCYYAKTSALAFLGGYLLFLAFEFFVRKDERKQIVFKIIILSGIFILGKLLSDVFINYCNRGLIANNHYQRQIMNIFPIDYTLLIDIILGIVFYLAFSMISMGCAMSCSTLRNSKDRLTRLILLMLVATIIEIVVCIVCTENRGKYIPNKICYRYIFYFYIPILICFIRNSRSLVTDGIEYIGGIICSVVALIYFVIKGNTIVEGIIDAPFIGMVANINNHIFYGFAECVTIGLMVIYIVGLFVKHNKAIDLYRLYPKISIVFCAGFMMINMLQYLYFNNTIVQGRKIVDEAVLIESIISDLDYDGMVYMEYKEKQYNMLIGCMLRNDVVMINDYGYSFNKNIEELVDIYETNRCLVYIDR